jgi:thymidylate synthase
MHSYLALLQHVMEHGRDRTDRTGVGTRSVFGYQFRHNMSDGFPLLTTKRMHTKSIVHELLWFLSGATNIRPLLLNGVTIWSEWPYQAYCKKALGEPLTLQEFERKIVDDPNFAKNFGELGPVYGYQWRHWAGHLDQINRLVSDLIKNPFSRRHIVSAWAADQVEQMALPPCHTLWQCYVTENPDRVLKNYLSLHLYARSIDSFLGLPFNIASYALLLSVLAQLTGMLPGELIISFGDLHIYKNHFAQVEEQLSRSPMPLPTLSLPFYTSVEAYRFEDFRFDDYASHPAIKAPIAV